ncbi:hypothetical protein Tco_0080564 [Tanacetum coccineum]
MFNFITEYGRHFHQRKKEINCQKRIKRKIQSLKHAQSRGEVRKAELVDLLSLEVVNKYYNDKLQYDRYCDKMLNRRAKSRITNCDVLTKKGPITLKVYREDGTREVIPNFKASDLHLGEWREDPLDKLNDLANKKRKHADDIHDYFKANKRLKSSVQYEDHLPGSVLNEPVLEIFFRSHQGLRMDDHARTFSSLLLAEVVSTLQVIRRLGSIFTLVYAAVQKLKKVYKAGKRLLYVKRNKAISLGKGASKVEFKFKGDNTPIIIQPPCYSASKIPRDQHLAVEVETKVEKLEECKTIFANDGTSLYTPFYYFPEELEYFSTNSGFPDDEKSESTELKTSKVIPELKLNLPEQTINHYVEPYVPPILFPNRLKQHVEEALVHKTMESLKKIRINRTLLKEIRQMENYPKYIKDLVANKQLTKEDDEVSMNPRCSALLQNQLPPKENDPGSFILPCSIGRLDFNNALADLGASINIMPFPCLNA